MMSEHMGISVEVWPCAADRHGIWLTSGYDALRSGRVTVDSEPHFEVELLLLNNHFRDTRLLHSTSWRPDGPVIVLTYMAVLTTPGPVRETYPSALPVSAELLPTVGYPSRHGATEVPVPRYIDVLYHGLRHLRFLLDSDRSAREALAGDWATHLIQLTPVLAGMYEA